MQKKKTENDKMQKNISFVPTFSYFPLSAIGLLLLLPLISTGSCGRMSNEAGDGGSNLKSGGKKALGESFCSFLRRFLCAAVDVSVSANFFSRSRANMNWAGDMGQESRSLLRNWKHMPSMDLARMSVVFHFLELFPCPYLFSSYHHD